MSTATSDIAAQMALIRDSRLRRAGLYGGYAKADCEAGKAAYSNALKGMGTYLHGKTGRGKTYIAASAVRRFVDSGRQAKMLTGKKLLDGIKAAMDKGCDDPHFVERMERIPLLAIDDLGMEYDTDWAVSELCALMNERINRGLPTIITSNHRLGEISDKWGVQGERLASRIAGSCAVVLVDGPDRRLQCRP